MGKKKIITIVCFLAVALYIAADFYNNIHTVIEGQVYRSAQLSGSRLEKLIENKKIKTIINLRGEHLQSDWHKTEKEVSKSNNVIHFDFKFSPHALPAFTQINRLVELIQKVEKPYLIHCMRGAERAGMASALILSIEKDLPLAIIKKQFSTRYGVLFFKDSVGELFFDEYKKWLAFSKKNHSRDNLLSFIKNDYIDAHGNIKYYIDSVSDVIFDRDKKASITQKSNNLKINGWAYDAKHFVLVKDLYLKIGEETRVKVDYRTDRPDVIKFFGLESRNHNLKLIGWTALFQNDSIPSGCYNLFFEFAYEDKREIIFNTGFELCIE